MLAGSSTLGGGSGEGRVRRMAADLQARAGHLRRHGADGVTDADLVEQLHATDWIAWVEKGWSV